MLGLGSGVNRRRRTIPNAVKHISRASWISFGLLPQSAQEDAPVLCRFAGAGVSLVFMNLYFRKLQATSIF